MSVSGGAAQGRLRLFMHGSIIAVIGLLSGFGLLFVILDSISVWPVVIELDSPFPAEKTYCRCTWIGLCSVSHKAW